MDGITALPLLLAKKRDLIIIMASTLTRRNAEISMKALSLGAADYIPKPETTRELGSADAFRHDLVQKIRHLGARVRRTAKTVRRRRSRRATSAPAKPTRAATAAPHVAAHAPATTRRAKSCGAARAAGRLIDRRPAGADDAGRRHRQGHRQLPRADHPAHAADLHDHPRRASRAHQPAAPRTEGVDGEPVKAGHIYLAPGGNHMRIARRGSRHRDRARRRPAGEFLQARGRSAVPVGDRGLAERLSGRRADRHGIRTACAAARMSSPPAATSSRRTRPPAWSGACPAPSRTPALCAPFCRSTRSAPKLMRVFSGERS